MKNLNRTKLRIENQKKFIQGLLFPTLPMWVFIACLIIPDKIKIKTTGVFLLEDLYLF